MRLHLDNHAALDATGQTGAASVQAGQSSQARNAQVGPGARDSVGLSGPSAALNRLATDRAARVQQLSAAVKSGSYQVPSASISSALVAYSLV